MANKKRSITTILTIGFSFIFIFTIILGVVGYNGMKNMKQTQKECFNDRIPALNAVKTITESVRLVEIGERGMMMNQVLKEPEIRKQQYSLKALEKIDKNRSIYETLTKDAKESRYLADFDAKRTDWMAKHDKFITRCEEKAALLDKGTNLNSPEILKYDKELMDLFLETRMYYMQVLKVLKNLESHNLELINNMKMSAEKNSLSSTFKFMLTLICLLGIVLISFLTIHKNVKQSTTI